MAVSPFLADAQKPRPKNLENKFSGNTRRFHFGFTLGYNKSNFLYGTRVIEGNDTLLSVRVNGQPGFNLGIVSSLHINNNLKLRFVPDLSFQEREFVFTMKDTSGLVQHSTRLESTFIDFPLLLKFRTNRVNNFAAYVIGGAQYSIDMQSNLGVKNTNRPDDVIKIKKHDFAGTIGGGVDFFLTYFKFGIELRVNQGFNNVLVQDDSFYARHLDFLRTQTWFVTLTFEG